MNFGKIKLFFSAHKREIALYLFCEVICILGLIWILRLWDADFSVPFSYSGDGLAMSTLSKGLIDNLWWTQNSFLGMPFGQVAYDRPFTDTFDFIIIKIIGLVSHNFAISLNLFYLLTFPLTALTTLYVFRTLRISPGPSVVGSLLFTFIPFHFLRGEDHLFYSSYFFIPLVILVIIWIYQGKTILYNAETKKIELGNYHTIVSLIICGLMAFQNVYFLFFTCFFLLVTGVFHSLSTRNRKYLISCSLLIGFMVVVLLINTAPTLLYQYQNGPNLDAVGRTPNAAEIYGLKITQLLFPINGHRIPFLSNITWKYSSTAPLINENGMSALGGFGALGFVLLIFWVFYRLGEPTDNKDLAEIRPTLDCLSTLNLSAVLLATTGGVGVLVAYLFSFSYIRGYNRISIFIAFFAILAVLIVLEYVRRNWCLTRKRHLLFTAVLCVLLIGGILDQTRPTYAPDYGDVKQEFLQDQRFIDKIETEVPNGSMIFQLPYMKYPESGRIIKMGDYSPAIAYLHSDTLRWSYGSIKGRAEADWENEISSQELMTMTKSLAFVGFNGIYVDSYGYADKGSKTISSLSSILQTTPLVSDDKRLYFFDMTKYNDQLKSQMTPEEFARQKDKILAL
jgi:phosphoglycerol transferase